MAMREYRIDRGLRRRTFSNYNSPFVKPDDLADVGFVYTGSQDIVVCAFCDIQVGGWERGDVPADEHLRLRPNCPGQRVNWVQSDQDASLVSDGCAVSNAHRGWDVDPFMNRAPNYSNPRSDPFMNRATNYSNPRPGYPPPGYPPGGGRGMVVADDGSYPAEDIPPGGYMASPISYPTRSHYPANANYNELDERVKSFTSYWPWTNHPTLRPADMAKAGFHYSGESDKVKCFLCSLELNNWETTDTPFGEHEKWRPECPMVKQHREEQIAAARNNTRNGNIQSDAAIVDDLQNDLEMLEVTPGDPPEDLPETNCVVCFDKRRAMAFIPCGHVVCCEDCGNRVADCTMCRKKIQNRFKIYLSS